MKRIRVLHLMDTLRRGGKERQLIELLKNIDKDRYESFLISLEVRADGYDDDAKGLVTDFQYMVRKYRWDLLLIFRIKKYCKENKIDVIQVWDGMCAFYAFNVSLFTGILFVNYSIQDTDSRRTYRHLIKRLMLKLSKNVIGNSIIGLKVYGVEKKGKVIYNGLDFKRFESLKKKANNKFLIGIVANLTEYKDYYTFFDAIKLLAESRSDFEVQIVGWGKLADEYKDYAQKIGISSCLQFMGKVNDAENHIVNFDIGVLCSYRQKGEGISNSVLEYMACGVPPVITDVGAAREIIDDGVNGLLFDAGNSVDLMEKIVLLIEDNELRNNISINAKAAVFRKFSYAKFIKSIEEYYEENL